jgi:CheY-like chemotaxis protein
MIKQIFLLFLNKRSGAMTDYSQISLLIIDDEEDIREIIKEEFIELGMKVHLAQSGQEALDLVDSLPIGQEVDIIISDFRMPNGDGLFVFQGLKQRGKNSLFFLCTGYSDVTKDQSVKMGINGYIRKPFSPEDLTKNVLELLQKKAA